MPQNAAKTKMVIRETVEHLLELSHDLDDPFLLNLLSMARIAADEEMMRNLRASINNKNRKQTPQDLGDYLRLISSGSTSKPS